MYLEVCVPVLKIAMQSHFRNLSNKLSTDMLFYSLISGPSLLKLFTIFAEALM